MRRPQDEHGRYRVAVALCVLGALAGPTAGSAYAAPAAPPPPAPGHGPAAQPPASVTDVTEAGAASPPAAGPEARRLDEIRRRIERLHDEVERAAEAYNAADERVRRQRERVEDVRKKIDRNEERLARLNDTAGAMARAQYRGGGLPQEARLLLRADPETFLHEVSLIRKGQHGVKGFLEELAGVRKKLDADARSASAREKELKADRKRKAGAREKVEKRLADAERVESRLAAEERERLRELERRAARERQDRWIGTGVLDEIDGAASSAGERAVAYALRQRGKDYEWGAEGPLTFDCSGLTQQAWAAAGKRIPRTSQEQWRLLPRVAVEDMRPGDLIIYKRDASHVGMYVGDGRMVHAPRTGRQITVEGAGTMPILGVVRPDGR